MKFAVVIFACMAVAVSAQQQYRPGSFNPFGAFQKNQYQNPFQNQYQNQYRKPSTAAPYRPYVPVTTPAPIPYVPVSTYAPVVAPAAVAIAKVSSEARNAGIVKLGNEINPDGSYNYFYETENGIAAQEQGVPRNFGGNPPVIPDVAQGSFSWTSPEGKTILITYTADENGYQPSGEAIPTSPPLPPQIARALDYVAKYVPKK